MKFLWMMKINFNVDWITFTWRFEIVRDKIIINSFEKFLKSENNVSIFALICNNFSVDFAQQISMFSFKLKLYKDCFNSKNAEMFLTHENENHVINLKFEKKSSYNSLYALLKKKLQVLRNYLLKNLALNRIRKFFNFVKTSMLFIFKKNESLRLCVNYWSLNAVIIKNKCFFSLIKKTLNHLMNVVYFIKLDFKNVYYRIQIQKNDEWMIVFRTRYDHFKYIVMSFDLINVSTTF